MLDASFDYRRFLRRRERLVNAVFVMCAAWWVMLMGVGIGARWWEPMARFKDTALWGIWTVDRVLAVGALVSAGIAVLGPWLVRHVRRPPQLILLLRDFQSREAARLAHAYVQRFGAAWGYWITLENVDFRAVDSLGGEAEVEADDGRKDQPPVGGWWFTSLAVGLVVTATLVLTHLDAAPLRWLRATSRSFGALGELVLGIGLIVVICATWFVVTVLIRSVLVTIQRRAFLPGRIDSDAAFASVLDTILARIRRRATTLTLGPLPVISVDDAWWQAAVLRCLAEARLVVFVVAERESEALAWEMDQVRQRCDPDRTLYIRLDGGALELTDGNGRALAGQSDEGAEGRVEDAVRQLLVNAP